MERQNTEQKTLSGTSLKMPELMESEFKIALDSITDAVYVIDSNFRIILVNQTFKKMSEEMGFDSEMLGKTVFEFIPALGDKLKEEYRQVFTSGKELNTQTHYSFKDKSYFLEVRKMPVFVEETVVRVVSVIRDITERKKADEALKQLLSLKNATLESTIDGILVVDLDGNVVSNNRRFLELWHIPDDIAATREDEKLLGYVLNQLSDPESFLQEVQRLYAHPAEESLDVLHFKDGRVFDRFSQPQKIDDKIVGRVWSFRDVTEQKKAEEALRKSEEKFRIIADFAYDWGYWQGPDKRFIYVSPSCERITGYTQQEFINNPDLIQEIIHPEDRKRVKEYIGKIWLSKDAIPIDFRIVSRSGEVRWIGHICKAVYDKTGQFMGRRGNNRDITERKKAEVTIKYNADFLTNIFASIQDGISILDTQLSIIRVNPTMENWYAHAMPLVGKKCYEAYHCSKEPCKICPTIRSLKEKVAVYELVPKRGLGGEIVGWLDLYSFPVFDTATGEVSGVIEYVRDVTQQKQAKEQLQYRIELEKLITRISASFVNFSLNNIKTEINLALELLGKFCNADRSYIFQVYDQLEKADCTYEWCALGIEPQIDQLKKLSSRDFPWMTKKLKELEVVHIPALTDLPFEAETEKVFLQKAGVKSLIIVPMVYGGSLVGFLGFDSTKTDRSWSEDIISLLKAI